LKEDYSTEKWEEVLLSLVWRKGYTHLFCSGRRRKREEEIVKACGELEEKTLGDPGR